MKYRLILCILILSMNVSRSSSKASLRKRENDVIFPSMFPAIVTTNSTFINRNLEETMGEVDLDILGKAKNGGLLLYVRDEENYKTLDLEYGLGLEIDEEETYSLRYPASHLSKKTSTTNFQGISGSFSCFRNLAETYNEINHLASTYPHLVEKVTIGTSHLNKYDIEALKLTNQNSTKAEKKSIVFAICGLSPRDLAPPEACIRFASMVLQEYGNNDPDISWILDFTEIHLIVQANPDGRKDEETAISRGDLLNMKTKNMNKQVKCWVGEIGVNLARNWPHKSWNYLGSSSK